MDSNDIPACGKDTTPPNQDEVRSPDQLESFAQTASSLEENETLPQESTLCKIKKDTLILIQACLDFVSAQQHPILSKCEDTDPFMVPICILQKLEPNREEMFESYSLHHDVDRWSVCDTDWAVVAVRPSFRRRPLLSSCAARKPLLLFAPDSFLALFNFATKYLEDHYTIIPSGCYVGYRLSLSVFPSKYCDDRMYVRAVLVPVVEETTDAVAVTDKVAASTSSSTSLNAEELASSPPSPHGTNHVASLQRSSVQIDSDCCGAPFDFTLDILKIVHLFIRTCEAVEPNHPSSPYHVINLENDGTISLSFAWILTTNTTGVATDLVHREPGREKDDWFFDEDGYRITGPISKLVTPKSFQFLFALVTKTVESSPPIVLKKGDFKGCTMKIPPLEKDKRGLMFVRCLLRPPLSKILY